MCPNLIFFFFFFGGGREGESHSTGVQAAQAGSVKAMGRGWRGPNACLIGLILSSAVCLCWAHDATACVYSMPTCRASDFRA